MKFLVESIDAQQNEHITDFYKFVCDSLGIINKPIVTFIPSLHTSSFGSYHPSQESVTVATEGRHIADILRTFAHELVHHVQLSLGEDESYTLEELEYEANAVAGMIMREYNKLHPELYGMDVPVDEPTDTETPAYKESSISDSQPLRPPYPAETFGESVLDLSEDAVGGAPINSAGAGNIAGIGIGPQGEPGITPKKKKTPMFTRKTFKQMREDINHGRL